MALAKYFTTVAFKPPPKELQCKLRGKIRYKLPIKKSELGLVVSPSSLDNLITNQTDEVREGTKIINFLTSHFQNPEYNGIITGLRLFVHNGYVHIVREGLGYAYKDNKIISGSDKITPYLVPNLSYFKELISCCLSCLVIIYSQKACQKERIYK